ncbi:MAG: hypothetical protein Q9226_002038 [Calogaya cf. arnoldii]
MKGRPLRLSTFSSPAYPLSSSSSPYICLRCRHSSSLRRPSHSTAVSSTPFHRRSYATERSLPDKFQDAFNNTIGKRLFKDGKIPGAPGEKPAKKPAVPPGDEGTTTDPVGADPYYTPATSGEALEVLGGASGWWEKAWDEQHQFQGWMRPTPMQDGIEIERAIERAFVEWYTVEKGSIEFRASVGAAHRLWANDRSWEMPPVGNFHLSQKKKGKVQFHWKREEDRLEMERWLLEPFQKGTTWYHPSGGQLAAEATEATGLEEDRTLVPEPEDIETAASTSEMEADRQDVAEKEAPGVIDGGSDVPDEALLEQTGKKQDPHRKQGHSKKRQPKVEYGGLQCDLSLRNHNLKFTVIKRVMQLTGIRIPDTAIQSIDSSHALREHLIQKPKPKKLAQILIEGHETTGKIPNKKLSRLALLPNVKILSTKHLPSMTETALGRQKVIEQQLDEHDIPVPFRNEMEQITAFEEERLRRRIDAVVEDEGGEEVIYEDEKGEERDMWSQAPLEDLSGKSEGARK